METKAVTVFMPDQMKEKLIRYQKDFEANLGLKISQSKAVLLALEFFLDKEHKWELKGKNSGNKNA